VRITDEDLPVLRLDFDGVMFVSDAIGLSRASIASTLTETDPFMLTGMDPASAQ
jgi:hypothetical protein